MKTKKIFSLIFLFFLLFSFLYPSIYLASAATKTKSETKVYITDYGDYYHSSDCQYLYKSKTAIGKYKAEILGYYACSVCGGKSNGYIIEYYYTETPSYPNNTNSNDNSQKSFFQIFFKIVGYCIMGVLVGYVLFAIIAAFIASFKK
jgi:hypothetical protein